MGWPRLTVGSADGKTLVTRFWLQNNTGRIMRRCIRDGAATLQKVVTGRCVPEFYCWMPSSGAHAVQQSTCLAHTEKKMHRHAAAAHSSRGFADRFATFHRKIPRQSSEPYFNLPFLDLLHTPLVVNYAASDAPATLSQGWSSSSVSQPDLIFTTLSTGNIGSEYRPIPRSPQFVYFGGG